MSFGSCFFYGGYPQYFKYFAIYDADENLVPMVREIRWSKHLIILSKCKDRQERQFYILTIKKNRLDKGCSDSFPQIKVYQKVLLK